VIRGDIESGRTAVGAKLNSEASLAQQYGVSRSVIREALRSCTALGLTVTRTGHPHTSQGRHTKQRGSSQ
jgi:GntR family transcriptional repressor for pyruvate dehydrogenase complex